MKYEFVIGSIFFVIDSERPLGYDDSMLGFMGGTPGSRKVHVHVTWDFQNAPRITAPRLGEDRIQAYYRQNGCHLCALQEGHKGFLSIAQCSADYQEITCYINEEPFLSVPQDLQFVLRMLPVRAMLQHFGIGFFHAAQVAVGKTGILFSAPSGTGKTTQARLWCANAGARLVCNDRTLVYQGKTYGFPVDGSEPVCSGEVNSLGAIVVLEQGRENRIRRLKPAEAMSRLMPQMVLDVWDPQSHERALLCLSEIVRDCPVYIFSCTPEVSAVHALQKILQKEGVL